ncbi:M13 family metallopeptidase [Mycolicibacterium sp. J2]|uniref:M13 family metallopeptidase n=1 Tax=Mycolicibacterium sp. J2 TaxID=2993511 RepID=UPI00224B0E1A|nr:M13 family metallopeptidase [Mycolicibacterium sp. J2]MCX2713038.1 M13 family metallopeptidase [Mycolicibacterium sp. J2]
MSSSIASGIDLTFVDAEVRPQHDLFGHVNGRWLADYEIPADRATDGAFRTLADRAEEQVRDLITEAAESGGAGDATRISGPTDATRIGDLYASFMDTDTVARRGLAPLLEELAVIDAAADADALAVVLAGLQRTGVSGGTGVYVDTDSKDSTRYLLHLSQSGLGLPDESYYRDPQHAAILAAYPEHIARMLTLVYGGERSDGEGISDGGHADTAARIVALETKLAAAHWDVVKRRDADLTYNLRTFAELPSEAPGFDWSGWVGALGAAPAEVVVRQPDFLTAFAALWAGEPLEDWKAWLRWRVISSRASLLTDDLVAENFDFYGRTLSGTEAIRDRWKRGVALVENLMGDAVGKLYVQKHFPPAAKARMDELVANLREAYRVSITNLDWMTPETRQRALAKLDKFTPKIGYPARWRDYSALVIDRADLYGNYQRGYAVEYDRELAKLGGPVDRDEWFMTPQTVNAYYNPGMNEIVFPAAILQPPFFDAEADDAANYGGIGAVIGHEIGHGFDDQGAKYDGDGNLVDWWTDADRAEFGLRTKALIEQYEAFTPRALDQRHHVNGAFTVGENIGDLGGLSIALLAYELSLESEDGGQERSDRGFDRAPVIDGLTGVQRVLFGWAQVWRTKSREAEAIRRLATDPHSPPEFRCNGVVRNIDAFYDAFGVTESDELYLEPDQRVRIWN